MSQAQTQTNLDPIAEIKKLRINGGSFAGGYLVAPNGSLNWYFANLGLIPLVQYLGAADLDWYIRAYLDLYLRSLEANATVRDVRFSSADTAGAYQLAMADSDDAYAGTFLSLTMRYLRASQNWAWWEQNKANLKRIAYYNLAVAVKANGLPSVFQAQPNGIGYLMDACEAYRGLRDFAAVLRDRGETGDANYYDAFASGIASAISIHLFDTARSGFIASDVETQAGTNFYPGTMCQVFPQAYGLSELSAYFDKAWNYLNRITPKWEDGRYNEFPAAILGFVAAKRNQWRQATTQMRTIQRRFTDNRAAVTINELGFYLRMQSMSSGRADI